MNLKLLAVIFAALAPRAARSEARFGKLVLLPTHGRIAFYRGTGILTGILMIDRIGRFVISSGY